MGNAIASAIEPGGWVAMRTHPRPGAGVGGICWTQISEKSVGK
jgi:hypothetical protein